MMILHCSANCFLHVASPGGEEKTRSKVVELSRQGNHQIGDLNVAADDFHTSVKHCSNEQVAQVSQGQCQTESR